MHHMQVSPRIRALMRQGAELALSAPPEWMEELDAATLAPELMRVIAEDPVLAAAMRQANRTNLVHWAAANVKAPGAPVAPSVDESALQLARDLVRRGLHEPSLDAFRTGQNAAWLRWMQLAFQLTSDPAELQALLDVSARSIHAFLDATIAALAAQMQAERESLTRGSQAERRQVVALILDEAPITVEVASERLGYEIDRPHCAAVVWTEVEGVAMHALESVAEVLARGAGGSRPLLVPASAGALWVWVPAEAPLELDLVRSAARRQPGLRVAVGSNGVGMEGFRKSHLDALAAQRMLAHLAGAPIVATFDDLRLLSLVTKDPAAAADFVTETLGDLAHASAELRETLLVYLEEGAHAGRAGARLHAHRNTLQRRLSKAEALLPRPLSQCRLQVAVALEILRWRAPA